MEAYLRGMPKAEIHLHLEGAVTPETIVALTERNGIPYFRSVEEIQASLDARPPGLMGFLEHHFKMQEVMQTRQDFYDATYGLARRLSRDNIVYADIFFDPQAHTSRGIAFAEFFEGIDAARVDARRDFGIEINLIMCLQRERSAASALQMLADAMPYRDRIIGLGMDSGPEYGNPPLKFADVYAEARRQGYFLTGHHDVDVQDSTRHIRQSIEIIRMDRLDHGLMASDEPALMDLLVERGLCLTGSPIKRRSDPQPQDIARIQILDRASVCVSLNTDDPEEFESGYLNDLLILFQAASGDDAATMTRYMLNAYRAL